MSAAPEIPEDDDQDAPPAPSPKERLAPRLGLKGQVRFITELRLRARMYDGQDAKEAWLLLEPLDLERLDDLAAGLDILVMEAEDQRVKSKWPRKK